MLSAAQTGQAAPTPSKSDPYAPYAPLLARGITGQTLSSFAVTLCERYNYPYWRYPVRSGTGAIIGWRYKRAGDDSSRRKYDWGTQREPDPVWPGRSCPGPCAEAVYNIRAVRTGQPAYVVAGEPDTWLLCSLGLPACSLLAGEGAVPAPALEAIAQRHPSTISVIYDHDETGRRGARTLAAALSSRGIAAVAYALPPEVGSKGDVCDFFGLCERDQAAFVRRLAALPPLPPLEEAQQSAKARAGQTMREGPQAHAQGSCASPIERFKARHVLADVIEASGTPLRAHQGGAYWQGRCPFHDDHSPSLVLWPERGYWRCYGCGLRGDVIDFIEAMERVRRGGSGRRAP